MRDEEKLVALFIPHPSSLIPFRGEVQEWLNWQHWKCCVRGTVPWVRIPPSPPDDCGLRTGGLRRAEGTRPQGSQMSFVCCLLLFCLLFFSIRLSAIERVLM